MSLHGFHERRFATVRAGVASLAFGGTLALCCLVMPGIGSAESAQKSAADAGEAFIWSVESDCAVCHEKQASSFEHEAADAPQDADGQQVDKDVEKVGAGAKAENGTSSAGAKASASMPAWLAAISGDVDDEGADETSTLASTHAGIACSTCHNDEKGLAEAHKDATGPKQVRRLSYTYVETETCLSCHGSWEDLAEKTADCTILTDNQGTVVNPHAAPETHIAGADGEKPYLSCYQCHDMHGTKTVAEQATYTCQGCHHENVYECHTCHK